MSPSASGFVSSFAGCVPGSASWSPEAEPTGWSSQGHHALRGMHRQPSLLHRSLFWGTGTVGMWHIKQSFVTDTVLDFLEKEKEMHQKCILNHITKTYYISLILFFYYTFVSSLCQYYSSAYICLPYSSNRTMNCCCSSTQLASYWANCTGLQLSN